MIVRRQMKHGLNAVGMTRDATIGGTGILPGEDITRAGKSVDLLGIGEYCKKLIQMLFFLRDVCNEILVDSVFPSFLDSISNLKFGKCLIGRCSQNSIIERKAVNNIQVMGLIQLNALK